MQNGVLDIQHSYAFSPTSQYADPFPTDALFLSPNFSFTRYLPISSSSLWNLFQSVSQCRQLIDWFSKTFFGTCLFALMVSISMTQEVSALKFTWMIVYLKIQPLDFAVWGYNLDYKRTFFVESCNVCYSICWCCYDISSPIYFLYV